MGLLLALPFVLGSVVLTLGRGAGYWWIAAFFGVGALILGLRIFVRGSLELDEHGFTCRDFGRSWTRAWRDVASFGVYRASAWRKTVGFTYVPSYSRAATLRRANRSVTGFDGMLGDTYGYRAERLVARLEEWRARGADAG